MKIVDKAVYEFKRFFSCCFPIKHRYNKVFNNYDGYGYGDESEYGRDSRYDLRYEGEGERLIS